MKKICVVLPTKNEEAKIKKVLEDVQSEIVHLGHTLVRIIVTDDSTDSTRRIAKNFGATVVIGDRKSVV